MKKFSEKQAGILNQADLKTAKGKALYWVMFGLLIAFCVITFFPALWMVLTAFKSSQEIYSSVKLLPENLTFSGAVAHVTETWQYLKLGRSMINTIIVSLFSSPFKVNPQPRLFPSISVYGSS